MKTKQPKETVPASSGQMLADALRRHLDILKRAGRALRDRDAAGTPRGGAARRLQPGGRAAVVAAEMSGLAQEQMRVLLLDTKNRVLGQRVIYQGNISSLTIRTAEVFRPAVVEAVPSIIVAHNHPSGDPEPSRRTRP